MKVSLVLFLSVILMQVKVIYGESLEDDDQITTTVQPEAIPEDNVQENSVVSSNNNNKTKTSSTSLPSLIGNIVTHLVPSIKKNMLDATSREEVINSSSEDIINEKARLDQENELQVDDPVIQQKSSTIISGNNKKDLYKRRRKTPIRSLNHPNNYRSSVKNATAAEILLKKLQQSQGKSRTYHDPGFKNINKNKKQLVRVRPRAKSLAELASQVSGGEINESELNHVIHATTLLPETESSPILTSNALLLDQASSSHHRIAPQGSHPFDWSKRHHQSAGRDLLRNKFRIFRNQALTGGSIVEEKAAATTTTKQTPVKEDHPEPTTIPENSEAKEDSTEVHVVTSINQEIQVDSTATTLTTTTSGTTTTVRPSHVKKISIPEVSSLDTTISSPGQSYQYISIGTPRPTQDNVLELEKLFLNEKLQLSSDPVKKKRKIAASSSISSKPGFLERPVRVDSSITVVSDLYEKNNSKSRTPKVKSLPSIFLPSTPPPASYVAPTQPYFQIDNNQEFVILNTNSEADQDHKEIKISTSAKVDLDDLIVENVEKILRIKVPNDPQLRHRGVSKSSGEEMESTTEKSYAFEYSVQEDLTGITHSRKETADENGVVRGVYEVLEPNCVIQRVEYQADYVKGFKVLKTSKRSCQQIQDLLSGNNKHELPYIVTPTATVLTTKRPRRKVSSNPTVIPSGYIPAPPVSPVPTKQVQSPPSIVVTTPSASIRQSLLEAQTGKIRQQQFNQFHNNKENIVKTGYTISTPPADIVKTGYRVGPSTPPPPVIVSSQSGILVNPGQQGTVDGTTTPFPTIINQSHGSTGFQGISFVKPHPRQRKRQPVTNPTLFGGFQDQQKSSLKSPGRPTRPIKPEPHYKKPTKPTFKPSTVTPASQSTSYDPFSFQVQPSTTPQERNDYDVFGDEIEGLKDSIKESGQHSVSQINVTPHSLLTDSAEGSTVLPVFVTSESYPELRRVPKDAQFDAHPPPPPVHENQIESRVDNAAEAAKTAFQRRNMLMNIILRPGGGDKSRALPRPKVDVRADGPNIIIIRMTFPDNENIQGLRAYTPDEAEDFSGINEILPPNTSVERITADSGEVDGLDNGLNDYNYDTYDDYEYDLGPALKRPPRRQPQNGYFAHPVSATATTQKPTTSPPVIPPRTPLPPTAEPLTRPTRPPRKIHKVVLPPQPPHHPGPPPKPSIKKDLKRPKRPRALGKRPKALHPPPPPVPPKPIFKRAKKQIKKDNNSKRNNSNKSKPKLYIQSSLKAGNQNYDYNVAVDRRRDQADQDISWSDWIPLPKGYHPAHHV